MGSYVEFTSPSKNNRKRVWGEVNQIWGTKKGQVTDDSEMAISLACGLLESNGSFNLNRIAYFYKVWIFSNPFDMGITTRQALCANLNHSCCDYSNKIYKINQKNSIERNGDSKSNGFLMRNSPLAVWIFLSFKKNLEKDFENKSFKNFLNTRKPLSNIISGNPTCMERTHC